MEKISQKVKSVMFKADPGLILDLTHGAIKDMFDFNQSFLPFGKAGGLQIPRCQGFAVDHYGFTLGALTLKPSGFCNVRVTAME
jgi:hypothetical protein